jgi:2-keto-3-deoxy-L-rhamnonate aldolase RhmA
MRPRPGRTRWLTLAAVTLLATWFTTPAEAQSREPSREQPKEQPKEQPRLNPVIDLLAAGRPVFGLYAPANRRARPGAPPPPADSVRTPAQLAAEALTYPHADYIFDGSMEGNFDAGYASFSAFARAVADAGASRRTPSPRLSHPLFVKTPAIARDPDAARERIRRQLDLGVGGIVFVDVESADELRAGIAAMRFASQGGTRPDAVGDAPARWGMGEAEYRARADVWPLNPKGELVAFAIVESKAGLARVREIAAVPGVGVLFPGAGTLRSVFTTTGADGQRVFDEAGWEAAIQQVLAACKEFNVPCGYPAGAADIERRMAQGFSVFVINWGEQGFKAVDLGRAAGNRRD